MILIDDQCAPSLTAAMLNHFKSVKMKKLGDEDEEANVSVHHQCLVTRQWAMQHHVTSKDPNRIIYLEWKCFTWDQYQLVKLNQYTLNDCQQFSWSEGTIKTFSINTITICLLLLYLQTLVAKISTENVLKVHSYGQWVKLVSDV